MAAPKKTPKYDPPKGRKDQTAVVNARTGFTTGRQSLKNAAKSKPETKSKAYGITPPGSLARAPRATPKPKPNGPLEQLQRHRETFGSHIKEALKVRKTGPASWTYDNRPKPTPARPAPTKSPARKPDGTTINKATGFRVPTTPPKKK